MIISVVGVKVSYARKFVERTLSGSYTNDRVTSVSSYGMAGFPNLTYAKFGAAVTIGAFAFSSGTSLVDGIDLPLVEYIDGDSEFGGLKTKKLVFPSCTYLGFRCIRGCSNLAEIDFHSRVTLGGSALHDGSEENLRVVVFRSTEGLSICQKDLGTPFVSGDGYIYVPKTMDDGTDGITAYEADTSWSKYSGHFRYIQDYTIDGTLMGELDRDKIGGNVA